MEILDKISTPDREIIDFEAMGFQCLKVLGKYNYRTSKSGLEKHKHDGMLEICFMEKGIQHYHIEGKEYMIKGGEFLLVFPGEEHGTNGLPEEKGRLFWLIVSRPKLKQRILNLSVDETNELIRRCIRLKSNRKFKGTSGVKDYIEKIFHVYKERDSVLKRIQITNLILGLFLLIIESGEKSLDNIISDEISEVCKTINSNLYEKISLETLAEKVNLSLSHFKYKFKKEVGFPPYDYILKQKIELSKSMLKKSKSVQDVAFDLAFESSSYFATVFKRYTGQTPSEYIKSS